MEGNKLQISGKGGADKEPLASYKAVPEADMEDETLTRPKNLIKAKIGSGEFDGADEKMLPDDNGKINTNSKFDNSEVKIILNEKQNGDAKLDIGDLKTAFVGLGKEELMKYAHDPFWVRLRWILFILFWMVWAGMLFGAIAIIYVAPKCNPPPPKTWWEAGPLAEIDGSSTVDDLKLLTEQGIKGFIVEWPEDTYAELNDTHRVLQLLRKCNETDINVIVELNPSVTNRWWDKLESPDKTSEFDNFYIWKSSDKVDQHDKHKPPNNWISEKNVSSWLYSEKRKQFYYAPTGVPHLNFRTAAVVDEFSRVIDGFLDNGAKGIRLRDVAGLLVDADFDNEAIDVSAKVPHTDYRFFVHSKTRHLLELGPLLQGWRDVVKARGNGPFMITDQLQNVNSYKVNGSLTVDLPIQSEVFAKPVVDVTSVINSFHMIYNVSGIEWPLWTHNAASLPHDVLDIITYLLPGVPLVKQDETINKILLETRESPSIVRGTFNYTEAANKTVLVITRLQPGNPGFLIALNPSDNTVMVDFLEEVGNIADDVTIHLFSKNYNETGYERLLQKPANKFPISPKSAIVLAYMLKKT